MSARDPKTASSRSETILRWKDNNLALQKKNLELKGFLNDREDTISHMRLKVQGNKVERHLEQAHLRDDLNKAVAMHMENAKKSDDEILRLKTEKKDLKVEINKHDIRVLELEQQLEHLELAFTRPQVQQRESALVPASGDVRKHPEYKHPNASRESRMHVFVKNNGGYPQGTGKDWTNRYGSARY